MIQPFTKIFKVLGPIPSCPSEDLEMKLGISRDAGTLFETPSIHVWPEGGWRVIQGASNVDEDPLSRLFVYSPRVDTDLSQ